MIIEQLITLIKFSFQRIKDTSLNKIHFKQMDINRKGYKFYTN